MDWLSISGNWVLLPPRPQAIVHFLGGAFVATAPHLTYRWLLEELAHQGYAIVATPFINTLDHTAIAQEVFEIFEDGLYDLYDLQLLKRRGLPIYGLGHSMGCKVHLLMGSLFPIERSGNILMSFNNYPARRSIPLVEQLSQIMDVEFTPSPEETNILVSDRYRIRRNLLIKFSKDTLDQTSNLHHILDQKFPGLTTLQKLNGDHQTPLGQNVSWSVGETFTPLDAIGQWIKQAVYQDLNQLKKQILYWLNPLLK